MAELDGRLEARAKRDDLPVAGGPVASAPCAGARRPDDCSLQDHGGIADECGQRERVVTYSLHSHKRGSHLSGKAPCHANLPHPGQPETKVTELSRRAAAAAVTAAMLTPGPPRAMSTGNRSPGPRVAPEPRRPAPHPTGGLLYFTENAGGTLTSHGRW